MNYFRILNEKRTEIYDKNLKKDYFGFKREIGKYVVAETSLDKNEKCLIYYAGKNRGKKEIKKITGIIDDAGYNYLIVNTSQEITKIPCDIVFGVVIMEE